jgi:hypothetical protein
MSILLRLTLRAQPRSHCSERQLALRETFGK